MRLLALVFVLLPCLVFSQSSYAPLNESYYHTIDRYEIKSGRLLPQIFTSVKPYKRSDIVAFADTVHQLGLFRSRSDEFNQTYLRNDSWEWAPSAESDSKRPFLRHFYRKKSDFYSVHTSDFDLHVNPVLYLGAGNDSGREDMLFINTRGIEARGMVDNKVGFYTYLTDNQAMLPSYVWDQMSLNPVVPYEGFWKDYKNGKGVDFLQARGYVTMDVTRHINIQFGHDRFFIGNGYRSLIFSDYQPPALFLKGNVKVWKLNYLFIVNRMTANPKGSLSGSAAYQNGYQNKYNAFHHLSLNIGKKLNVGVFESVMFGSDSSDHFRLDYLNPIIFYRAVEQQNGSSDNVLLGLDFKWNLVRSLSLYGQLVLDEFLLDHILSQDGWWANKFAIQGGAKYIDALGIKNLDLQGEVNVVRPYTYSHNTISGSYSNYSQPIAHPLGANFTEIVGIVRYQPVSRLNVTAKLVLAQAGRDTTGVNWGGNILKDNTTRQQELNNTIGQGIANDIVWGSVVASWQVRHNLFVDVSFLIRQSKSAVAFYNNNTSISSLALRWNIPQRLYEF